MTGSLSLLPPLLRFHRLAWRHPCGGNQRLVRSQILTGVHNKALWTPCLLGLRLIVPFPLHFHTSSCPTSHQKKQAEALLRSQVPAGPTLRLGLSRPGPAGRRRVLKISCKSGSIKSMSYVSFRRLRGRSCQGRPRRSSRRSRSMVSPRHLRRSKRSIHPSPRQRGCCGTDLPLQARIRLQHRRSRGTWRSCKHRLRSRRASGRSGSSCSNLKVFFASS
mmetsp:Transcript_70085/g.164427  ORF Transcript_70085/g.164427 Transcript_70085/m.164427 type:complete len:219 (+) Transcript_70085:353-1009(+)